MRRERHKATPGEAVAFFVMIGGLGALIFQIDPLDNTLHGVRLFFIGGAPGVLVGALLSYRINERLRSNTRPSKDRLATLIVAVLGLGFGSAAIVSYWNIHGEQGPPEEVFLPVFDKGIGGLKTKSYYVHVRWGGENARLWVRQALYDEVSIGQDLVAKVSPGALGYAHVTAFIGVRPAA